jgi:hypothetical protein
MRGAARCLRGSHLNDDSGTNNGFYISGAFDRRFSDCGERLSYLLKFGLYDAASNGTLIDMISELPATVSNGVFTVQFNFTAANTFDDAERYLQISVKRNAADEDTSLSPRQRITSTPYAIRALKAGTADTSTNATNATTAANATTADTATNAQQLGGVAANYLQQNGSGANLTNLNAGSVASGTLDDARLSANVELRNSANTFTGSQTVNGNLAQTGTTTVLNLANGFVARGAFGTGAFTYQGRVSDAANNNPNGIC